MGFSVDLVAEAGKARIILLDCQMLHTPAFQATPLREGNEYKTSLSLCVVKSFRRTDAFPLLSGEGQGEGDKCLSIVILA